MAKKKWIAGMHLKKGALRKTLRAKKGEPIPVGKLKAAAKKKGKTGMRARLALKFRAMH